MVNYFWTIGIITLLFYLSFVFFLVLQSVFAFLVSTRFLSDMGLSLNRHSRGSRRRMRGITRRRTRGGGRRVVRVSQRGGRGRRRVGKVSNKNGFARRRAGGGGKRVRRRGGEDVITFWADKKAKLYFGDKYNPRFFQFDTKSKTLTYRKDINSKPKGSIHVQSVDVNTDTIEISGTGDNPIIIKKGTITKKFQGEYIVSYEHDVIHILQNIKIRMQLFGCPTTQHSFNRTITVHDLKTFIVEDSYKADFCTNNSVTEDKLILRPNKTSEPMSDDNTINSFDLSAVLQVTIKDCIVIYRNTIENDTDAFVYDYTRKGNKIKDVRSFLKQEYPNEIFEVCLINDDGRDTPIFDDMHTTIQEGDTLLLKKPKSIEIQVDHLPVLSNTGQTFNKMVIRKVYTSNTHCTEKQLSGGGFSLLITLFENDTLVWDDVPSNTNLKLALGHLPKVEMEIQQYLFELNEAMLEFTFVTPSSITTTPLPAIHRDPDVPMQTPLTPLTPLY